MQLEQLKKSLFGYEKDSVYQYIASMEADFSARLMEKDRQAEAERAQTREQIASLEQEVRALREAHEAQQSRQLAIADALLDAQAHAGQLREENTQQAEALRRQIEEEAAAERRRLTAVAAAQQAALSRYRAQIESLRAALRQTIAELDGRVAEALEEIEKTAQEQPEPESNMSLFARQEAPED